MTKSQWKDKWQQIRLAFKNRSEQAFTLRKLYPACFGSDRLANRASIRANLPAYWTAEDFLRDTVEQRALVLRANTTP